MELSQASTSQTTDKGVADATGSFATKTESDAVRERLQRSLSLEFEAYRSKLSEVETELKGIKEDFEKAGRETNEKISELKRDQQNVIQTLSIFVAFFTFVSVEFKILTSVESNILNVCGFTLILLGSLLLFVVLIDAVLGSKFSFKKIKMHKPRHDVLETYRRLSGYSEEVDFLWRSPSTWGDAIKIKVIPLLVLSLSLIGLGVYLVVLIPLHVSNISFEPIDHTNSSDEFINQSGKEIISSFSSTSTISPSDIEP